MFKLIVALFMAVSGGTLIAGRHLGYDPSAVDRVSCEAGQTVCDNLRQCVSIDLFCNGYPDCDDGSDEKRPYCFYRYFNCVKYPTQRIRSYLRCDGEVDCPDGSDEVGCRTKPSEPSTTTPSLAEIVVDNATDGAIADSKAVNYESTTSELLSTTESKVFEEFFTSPKYLIDAQETTNYEPAIVTSTESAETNFMTTADAQESNTFEHHIVVNSTNNNAEIIKSEDVRNSPLFGLRQWIIITIAFFAGLVVLLAAIAQFYLWTWKRSIIKQSHHQPTDAPEINNEDLFRTHSFMSVSSTSRSLKSSDFYFINPSIVFVDSHH